MSFSSDAFGNAGGGFSFGGDTSTPSTTQRLFGAATPSAATEGLFGGDAAPFSFAPAPATDEQKADATVSHFILTEIHLFRN